eukprot:scaffold275301_cov28-Tisochrysis_lutea.AAC.5
MCSSVWWRTTVTSLALASSLNFPDSPSAASQTRPAICAQMTRLAHRRVRRVRRAGRRAPGSIKLSSEAGTDDFDFVLALLGTLRVGMSEGRRASQSAQAWPLVRSQKAADGREQRRQTFS